MAYKFIKSCGDRIKSSVTFFRKITTALIFLITLLSFCPAYIRALPYNAAAAENASVTILHTNDIHSHLTPFDMPGAGKNLGGSARHYEFIKKVRSQTPDALLLDAGDIFQGTPFYTFFKGEAEMKIFTLLGYDATTLGNHDLDDGLDNLLKQLKHASFPMLCANVFYKKNDKPVFESHKIIRRGGVNIALMGAIGKTAWDVIPVKLLEKIYIADEKKTIFALAERLKKEADLVVLLSHLGYEPDLEFTKSAKNIDVVVGGHTNTILTKPHLIANGAENGIGGTLILQGFKWGVYIGRLDVDIDLKAKKIISYNGALNLINSGIAVDESSPVSLLIKDYEKKMGEQVNVKLGVCETEMSYSDDEKHKRDMPLGILICDILKKAGGSDISIINSGGIRDMMPAGDITIATTLNILPFDNSIAVMELKGADLVEIFNYIATKYGEISGYQFDSGVSFTLDIKAKKALDIKINGAAVELDRVYRLSTISYMAEGNQNGDIFFKNAANIKDNGFYLRDAMIEYIKEAGVIKAPAMRVMNIID